MDLPLRITRVITPRIWSSVTPYSRQKQLSPTMMYFPSLFNDSDVKEYYDLLRKRTLEILNGIVAGKEKPNATDVVEKLTTELVTYSNPKVFTGSNGIEIQFDRQFENLCLVLSEQLHVDPKKYSVLEFYNAFDFVKERQKQLEKAQKRGRN